MSPTPDWDELGKHNRPLLQRIRVEKMIKEKRRKDRREAIRVGILSIVFVGIGVLLYVLH